MRSVLNTDTRRAGAAQSSITVTCIAAAGPPAKLAFGTQPGNAVSNLSIPDFTVRILDASNVQTSSNAQVAVAINANPGSGTLSGVLTATASNGVATFSGLKIDKAGIGYTLNASSGVLAGATSGTFNVSPGATTQFTVTAPSTVTQGVAFSSLTVTAKDAAGNTTPAYAGTVHFTSTDGAAVLPGDSTLNAGTRTFASTTLNTTGAQSITATDGSITGNTGTITVQAPFPTAANASANAAYSNGSPAVPTTIDLAGAIANAAYVRPETLPSHGTLNLAVNENSSNKTMVYTPSAGYRGSDSFSYRSVTADNSMVSSAAGTVTITVANPVLTASVTGSGAAAGAPLSNYAIVTSGGFGTRTCAAGLPAPPTWLTINPDCTLSGTPEAGGPVSFGVNVTDQSNPAYTQPNVAVGFTALSNDATLSNLTVANGASNVALTPSFLPTTLEYTASVASNVTSVTVTPTAATAGAALTVNGANTSSGSPSAGITLAVGQTAIPVHVVAQDGTTSKDYTIRITRAVPVPTLTSLSAGAANGAGSISGGGSASLLTLNGADFSNATSVTIGNAAIASAAFASRTDTAITLTVPTATAAGVSAPGGRVSVTVSSIAGDSAPQSFAYVLTPTVNAPTTPTANRRPTLSGTGLAGATINLTLTGPSSSTPVATVLGGGTWSFTPSFDLPDGSYSVQATQTLSGVTSDASGLVGFEIDATGPAAPVIATPSQNQLTSSTVTLTGTTASGSTVEVAIDSGGFAPATVTGTSWSYTATGLSPGARTATALARDALGNASANAVRNFQVAAAPTITSLNHSGGTTAGNVPVTLTGTGLTDAVVTVAGIAVTVTSNSGSSLVFETPAQPAGPAVVVVTTLGGTASTGYTYIAPVTLAPAGGGLTGTTGIAYSQAFTPGDGTAPYSLSFSGPAIPGLAFASGTLSGTPTAAGSYDFTINVSDSSAPLAGSAFTASQAYTLQIGRQSQTITFTGPGDTSLSAHSLILSATATSGQQVTFTSNTTAVCTVSNQTLTLVARGTCSIVAEQAGNATYDPAPPVPHSFTVTPAPLAVLPAAAVNAAVGANFSQANPASGGVDPYDYALLSGPLPSGTTLDAGTGTVSGRPTVAGTFIYRIQATDRQSPAAVADAAVTVTIAAGSQTISFTAPANAAVGSAPYALSASASSLLAVDFSSATPGICSVSGNLVTFLTTGNCVINADQPGDANWNAAPRVQQTINVGAAAPVSAAISFAPASLGAGATGRMTLTFGNGNASTTPAFDALITAPALVTRAGNMPGGTCAPGTTAFPGATTIQLGNLVVPAGGSCTVIFDYTGTTAGSAGGFTLGAFTPSGYPTTSSTTGNPFAVVPTITAISPVAGSVSQVVTITGTGFSTTPGNNSVTFGAAGNGTVTAASATSLTVTAPAAGSSSVAVTVTVNGQASNAASYAFINRPVAADKSATVAYNTLTTINLTSALAGGGPHTSIWIATGVQHGTTSISGDDVTYTPNAGYIGPDSFTYYATGPGGASDTKQVSITVAPPGAPVANDKSGVAIPYNDPGTVIDLSGSITGIHSSIAASVPTNGTVTIAGDVATYKPNPGYYGADSFTYTATGPGGTSAPATVYVTVAAPAAPIAADRSGVAVPYASTGTAIDLTASITGVHMSIAASTPANGTVSVAGNVVTYTPNPGHYGADSFTYTATGPGGTSAPATVSVLVATPPAPSVADRAGVMIAFGSTGTEIDLAPSITGVHTDVAVATAPAHGTATAAGDRVTYTPANGYYGADSFTYTANGPGGTSAPATVSLTVATPTAPVAADRSGVAVPYASAGTPIDLAALVTGVHSSIIIASPPAHGTATIAGDVATYTPASGYHGADSFTYTAAGPGGTSAPATVSLTVATPAAPAAADKIGIAVPYAGTGTAIDLSASITGVHSSIAIGTAPAHGTVTIAGDVITYTPAATYYGADSFTYIAAGPGGTSAPATVSLTVATPPAPVVGDRSAVAVPYASTGTAVDLSSSVTGVHDSIAIVTAPAHGAVTIAGDVVTYTPAAGYYGADSFTYAATGPGGTSAPATVSLTVAAPAAPVAADRNGIAVPYAGAGTAIDLSSSITGVHSGIAIAAAPAHGTVMIAGDVVTYTPVATYHGADSFTYTATGPGGASNVATVNLTVATPPPPSAAPGSSSVAGSTTTTGSSVQINLSSLVTGVYDTIQIASQPAHGAVTLSGGAGPSLTPAAVAPVSPYIATYTPAPNYTGTDSFTYVAVGPGGTSAPGTVTITVIGQVPVAMPKTAIAGDGQMVSVMLTEGAARGPFTGANVVSVSPANAATTAIVAAGNGSYRLDVTPASRFGGTILVTYTLSNLFGVSEPSTVTFTVQARPDPRNDPDVAAVSEAQAETTRRFARAQVSNFMRRTEQLHNGGGSTGLAMGVTLNSRDGTAPMQRPTDRGWGLAITERMRMSGEDPALGSLANDGRSPLSGIGQRGYGRTVAAASGSGGEAAPADAPSASLDDDGTRRIGSVATWAGGAIDIGTRDRTTDRSKITATSAGLSAGADIKLSEGVLIGLGGGYGNDLSRIGTAAQVRGTSTLYAAYASIQPAGGVFIDGMVGRGQLDFTTRRIAAAVNAVARGSRDGSYTVAAISLGVDRMSGPLQWSLYGRGEYLDADLDAYVESGAGRYDLRFDARQVGSITGTVGGRVEYRQKASFGSITPRVRAEWNHEFADVDAQWLDYADIPGAAVYDLAGSGWKREQLQLSVGTRFDILSGWSFDFETGLRTGQGEKAGTLQLRLSKKF